MYGRSERVWEGREMEREVERGRERERVCNGHFEEISRYLIIEIVNIRLKSKNPKCKFILSHICYKVPFYQIFMNIILTILSDIEPNKYKKSRCQIILMDQ